MATRIETNQIQNLQQIEATVAGPEDANRLFTFTGQFDIQFSVIEINGNPLQKNETFSILLGPPLGRKEFFRAIGAAWLTKVKTNTADSSTVEWGVSNVDADYDDESKQVELRVEVFGTSSHANLSIGGIGFQVTILAGVVA